MEEFVNFEFHARAQEKQRREESSSRRRSGLPRQMRGHGGNNREEDLRDLRGFRSAQICGKVIEKVFSRGDTAMQRFGASVFHARTRE